MTGAVSRMLDENGRSVCGIEGAGSQPWCGIQEAFPKARCASTHPCMVHRDLADAWMAARCRTTWWLRLTGAYGAGSGAEGWCCWEGRSDGPEEKDVSRKMLREARRETHEEMSGWLGPRPRLSRKCAYINCDMKCEGVMSCRLWSLGSE